LGFREAADVDEFDGAALSSRFKNAISRRHSGQAPSNQTRSLLAAPSAGLAGSGTPPASERPKVLASSI
jgi:hypothetical protein